MAVSVTGSIPPKNRWKASASSGEARFAVDDLYATSWKSEPAKRQWLQIDLGDTANLAGVEIYWGGEFAEVYELARSEDGKAWQRLCATRHGEGGQDVFGFPPVPARFVRWSCVNSESDRAQEIVEINLYSREDAARVMEESRADALGVGPVNVPVGESLTVDLGRERFPLGALIEWGASHGTDFSVALSDDGREFREAGRISTGDGGSDSFYWRPTTGRFVRLTIHAASAEQGAIVNELKLRILNKDRMPIGALERAAAKARSDLYPQGLLERQVYWTALGEYDSAEQALIDEYGDLEPRRGSPQITPLVRLNGKLFGAPASASFSHTLLDGALPIPTVKWTAPGLELQATAFARGGQAIAEYRVTNRSDAQATGALVLAVRPVQINPYWQHGGHAAIMAIAADANQLDVNGRPYAAFSPAPDNVTIADFDDGDVVRLIDRGPCKSAQSLKSDSGLLSAACEFRFSLVAGASISIVVAAPMRDGVAPDVATPFAALQEACARDWRAKLGPRRIVVGDREVSDTVAAQTALILVNSTRTAFKPGPRNYDRTWIRDGSAQAQALLWAGLANEAKAYVLWYAERIYEDGMVPPILNVDGAVNRGYGSDIEYDAQGEFVGIAAEVFRITKDREFLETIFEPVLSATRYLEQLAARTDEIHGVDTRFHGLIAPSISHEGYSKPSFSYFDDYFALSAWRNCAFLARAKGDEREAQRAEAKAREFAENLTRSIRLTAEAMKVDVIPGSADRNDVDPTSTSIAFEPCEVADALPPEFLGATYDRAAARLRTIASPGFTGNYSPYDLRNLNAFVELGRFDDAFCLLSTVLAGRRPPGWRGWAEVVWSDPRAPDYVGDMPHTWIGAEFATAVRRMLVRENGRVLELFRAVPDAWWQGEGIALNQLPTAFGDLSLRARRSESRLNVEMNLAGPGPDLITFRYPGAKRAFADGAPCEIRGDLISAPKWRELVVEF